MDFVISNFSGLTAKYTWAITSAISPTPARPCSTYIRPQVMSPNRYGLRGKVEVRTRNIMNAPVSVTDSPASTMMKWYSLFSIGYFANLRGAGADSPKARRHLLRASSISVLSGHMDQGCHQNVAWMT